MKETKTSVTKSKRGGRRPGAGRKPKPIDALGKYLTYEQLTLRRDLEHFFKNGKALKAPEGLSSIAYNKWNEIMASYVNQEIDVLNVLDVTQLTLYVQSYERYMEAYNTWKKLQFDSSLDLKRCFKIMQDETIIMARLAPDLCLTPTGRAKFGIGAIKAAEKEKEDSKAMFQAFLGSLGEN